ncbi:MAG: glycosyl hydrolase family 17 protein [Pseudomonadales bacterium]
MSGRLRKPLSLAGLDLADLGEAQLTDFAEHYLLNGMHGVSFSGYEDGQTPEDDLVSPQVHRRLSILAPYVSWVRSFSSLKGHDQIARLAKARGLKTMVGAWISDDLEQNELEIASLIDLAKSGLVDIAAVGNEVMYREELEEGQLLSYIERFKAAVPETPVGYVDAYYQFEDRPAIVAACDLILANCYPFWEGCSIDYALLYMKDMYRRAQDAAQGKRVVIAETGWPTQGKSLYGAVPSKANALRYFVNTQHWSQAENIEIFYFSSFDESWKVGDEGDVGAHWGLWDSAERSKLAASAS